MLNVENERERTDEAAEEGSAELEQLFSDADKGTVNWYLFFPDE